MGAPGSEQRRCRDRDHRTSDDEPSSRSWERPAQVQSDAGAANIRVESGGASKAELALQSPANVDAKLSLANGAKRFEMLNDADQDKLVVTDGAYDLLRLSRTTGEGWLRGDMTVGNVTGARAMTVQSTDAAASLSVLSGGTGRAEIKAAAQDGAMRHSVNNGRRRLMS